MTSIGPGIPFHAARAYGLGGPAGGPGAPRPIPGRPSSDLGGAAAATGPAAIRETFAPSAAAAASRADAIAPAMGAARPAPATAARLERLVGGRVPGRVDFTGSAPTASRGDVLPLYTRAADKVEASVAVRLGSSLDLRG